MQLSVAIVSLLLVTVASAAPEQVSNSNSAPAPVQVVPVAQSVPVNFGSPVQAQPVVSGPHVLEGSQVSSVVGEQPVHHANDHEHHARDSHDHHAHDLQVQHHHAASHYAPAGMVKYVTVEQAGGKPAIVRNFEQYGQPEPASLPANYKPFGSWGLYIGGDPADGYYTNYYKALGNTVDKQQVEQVKPSSGGVVSPTAALSPMLRQASFGSSPVGGDYYPFAYSTSDLNSASRVGAEHVHNVPSHGPSVNGQVYSSPSAYDSANPGVSSYADSYATKKVGAAYAQKEVQSPSKGYQSRSYVVPAIPYASPMVPVAPSAHQPGAQVVAYPVPVGSQIVGSQQGVEGAFSPYGVHAFTRYAVKPTVVNSDSGYYYNVYNPTQTYKQQVYSNQPAPVASSVANGASYYPFSFYGYPINQLHYSQGSIVPSYSSEVHHGPSTGSVVHSQVEPASSDKVENEDKQVVKQQKRA